MKKEKKNDANLDLVRAMPCAACGKPGPSDPDHIKTRGAGGIDAMDNLWPLCRWCHTFRHKQGLQELIRRFPVAKKELLKRGWYFDEVFRKWLNAKDIS